MVNIKTPKIIPYKIIEDEFCVFYKEMDPTGKYKIVNGPYHDNVIYVENRVHFLFIIPWSRKEWVSERNITFLPKRTQEIFICKGDRNEK